VCLLAAEPPLLERLLRALTAAIADEEPSAGETSPESAGHPNNGANGTEAGGSKRSGEPKSKGEKDGAARAHAATALLTVVCEEVHGVDRTSPPPSSDHLAHQPWSLTILWQDPEELEGLRTSVMAALVLRFGAVGSSGGKPEAVVCRAALSLLETIPEVDLGAPEPAAVADVSDGAPDDGT
jgi:hypothetical protein